jgi:hypothetical protein
MDGSMRVVVHARFRWAVRHSYELFGLEPNSSSEDNVGMMWKKMKKNLVALQPLWRRGSKGEEQGGGQQQRNQ